MQQANVVMYMHYARVYNSEMKSTGLDGHDVSLPLQNEACEHWCEDPMKHLGDLLLVRHTTPSGAARLAM